METSSVDNDLVVLLSKNFHMDTMSKNFAIKEAINKEMCKIFKVIKYNSLQITIEANKKFVDFLVITLDLRTTYLLTYLLPFLS